VQDDLPQPSMTLLNHCLEHWAKNTPEQIAMIQHEDGKSLSYKKFNSMVDIFALKLLSLGLQKGDRLATQLVLVPEHVIFMYACFKIGVIIAPLDLRLKADEIVRDVNKIEAKAFFFLGNTEVSDFREIGKAVQRNCPSVEHFVQFSEDNGPGDIMAGASSIHHFMNKANLLRLKIADIFSGRLKRAYAQITPRTAALIIYTTGTTGAPKPALLCHENILVQNQILIKGLGDITEDSDEKADENPFVSMVNLPPSHVGCVTETLMSSFYVGGKAVLLRIFDVKATLEAIQEHKVSLLGQIPTQYRMLWAHPDYQKYNLSSLQSVIYAGAAADLPFLERLAQMAKNFGTGLGMTENAGFATFSAPGTSPADLLGQVGCAFPELAEVSIRKPMNDDGSAGEECDLGDAGEICYHPPVVFLGYFKQPQETQKAISKEGLLYTGDLGCFKLLNGAPTLYLSGRRKFVIKQKGYNVFPTEVEDHIARLDGVDQVEVLGSKHKMFDEAIFAYVKLGDNSHLSTEQIMEHCKNIASYKRPHHVEIWPSDKDFPLTRSAKVDKMALKDHVETTVARLRSQGQWDA